MKRVKEEERKHIEYIIKNLGTRKKWKKYDYVDFYERDIRFLLGLINKYLLVWGIK